MIKVYNKEFLVAFGENLKMIRKSQNLTQNELADLAKIGRSQIIRIEQGQINTTISTILVLARALEVPAKDLLDFPFSGK